MDLLVLGGTRFAGRFFVEGALAAGHRVTVFHRGTTGADLHPGAERLLGDRDGGLGVLAGRRWDAAIDFCGYVPRVVGAGVAVLRDAVPHYTFVSSVSAYAEPVPPDATEDAPLATLADPAVEEITGETYGGLKAACEAVVHAGFPGRSLVVRPGLIVGPNDPTDRFPYWPRRLARGGRVLVPDVPALPVQVIDARDLAGWMLAQVEGKTTGTFNAVGPRAPLALRECLERIRAAVGSDATFEWVDESFLVARGVLPWMEIPLWLHGAESGDTFSGARAWASGLFPRPLEDTARDTLAWDLARVGDAHPASPALTPEREAELLREWDAR